MTGDNDILIDEHAPAGATRPAASMIVAGPVTKSPQAKIPSTLVWNVSGSATTLPRLSSNCSALYFLPSGPTGVVPLSGGVRHDETDPPGTNSRVSVTPR